MSQLHYTLLYNRYNDEGEQEHVFINGPMSFKVGDRGCKIKIVQHESKFYVAFITKDGYSTQYEIPLSDNMFKPKAKTETKQELEEKEKNDGWMDAKTKPRGRKPQQRKQKEVKEEEQKEQEQKEQESSDTKSPSKRKPKKTQEKKVQENDEVDV